MAQRRIMDGNRKKIYFELEIKKGFALIPSFLLMLGITAAVLAAAAAIFCAATDKKHVLPHLDAAIVASEEDELTMEAVSLVENEESVRSIASFEMMEKEEAETAFDAGKVQAVIYLPDNLYDSIYYGENLPITVKINRNSGLTSDLFRELIRSGVSLIQTGESSVYAMAAVSGRYPLAVSEQDLINSMAVSYIAAVLNRNGIWNESFFSPYQNMNVRQYYALSVILAAALLFSMAFSVYYSGGERTSHRLLALSGVGEGTQCAAKVAAMTLVLWILFLAAYFILYLVDFLVMQPAAFLLLLPAAFALAAYTHFLYSFLQGENAVFFYTVITVILFLLSGGLVPSAVFPEALEKTAGFLPVYYWEQYLARVLYGGAAGGLLKTLAVLLLFAAVMIPLGVWRWKHAGK